MRKILNSDIEAIVFDLDATLINLGGNVKWHEAQKKVIELYIVSGCDEIDVNNCSKEGLFSMLDKMWELLLERDKKNAYFIQKRVYDEIGRYELEGSKSCSLMPRCIDTLRKLKDMGLRLGICTSNSKEAALNSLRKQKISRFFVSLIGRDPKYRMKPYPDQLLACFLEIGVEPSKGVMVGDSPKDVIAGKNAGSFTIAVPAYFTKIDKLMKADPDLIIGSLGELPVALSYL
jgi:HAD superfamily hydrolase (TIGR01549 family)